MSEYRKKPVVVNAVQFTDETRQEIIDWAAGAVSNSFAYGPVTAGRTLDVRTLEGEVTAQIGDYIICGVQGEFYPCKPDIFRATYDAVQP